MSKTDQELMTDYGITSEQTFVYRYKEHKYNKLSDAVKYAKSDKSSDEAEIKKTA